MEQTIINFENITKFPLRQYFIDCEQFFKISYNQIARFYSGKIEKVEAKHIKALVDLLYRADNLNEQFKQHTSKFVTVDYWDLLDMVDDIRRKLQTTSKLSKYLRSSRTDFNFSSGYAHPYVMNAEQTLENISENILQDANSNDDWEDIALKNDLKEVNWDIDGGTGIILYKEFFINNFVTSVIDNMIAEKIYGLDFQKHLQFEDDDLKVLSYKATALQTVNILSRLCKGDIPEFPSLGIDSGLYIGSNLGSLAFSSIIREMTRLFRTDDLFSNFEVTDIKVQEDGFYLEFAVDTKYKLLIEETTLIR